MLTLSNARTNPVQPGRVAVGGTNPATLMILDNDRAGTLAFNASTYTVSETGGTVRVTFVTRTGGTAGGVTVDFQAVNGTATSPATTRCPPARATRHLPANETTKFFDVTIGNNAAADGPRTFTLRLANPTGGAILGPPSQALVTIKDDEQTVRFASPGFSVLENKGPAQIVIERLGTPTGTVVVNFATANGTATAPADYAAVNRR